MIDDFAKNYLHNELKVTRQAVVWKLDGLSEYDIRRPLTATGTNLLGLVKHLATWEARYLGEIFDRPFPEPLPRWQDADGSDLWVAQDETREQIIDFYQRAWEHADATIKELPIDALGHVPWWPRPDVQLFNMIVHVLQDTTRHAGHADILREQLDGRTGVTAEYEDNIDAAARDAYWTKVEKAARWAGEHPTPSAASIRSALDTTFDADRPTIVVLCGSTRFYDQFREANHQLTMAGRIVLSVGFYPHTSAEHGHGEGVGHNSAEKITLDELHKRKIDLADEVHVLNVDGYIGESTRSEIAYAEAAGKPITYLEDVAR